MANPLADQSTRKSIVLISSNPGLSLQASFASKISEFILVTTQFVPPQLVKRPSLVFKLESVNDYDIVAMDLTKAIDLNLIFPKIT